jgi:hypothetical protein
MNLPSIFGIISALLSALCYFPYIKDILLKKSKPERASWLIWSILGSIAFFTQLSKGATDSLWLTGAQTIGVVIVFLLSTKFGTGGLNKRDLISLVVAGLGLIVWFLTKDALYALIIVILVDGIGVYLTLYKAYKDPESETMMTWILAGLSGLFAIFAVGTLNYILLLYPIYIVIANLSVVFSIILGKNIIRDATN